MVNTTSADDGAPVRAGYRRSAGSPRGEARRRELLDRVADDLAANGLPDFSLRRAARAAGTTHKVLLYHFDGADDLLRQAVLALRERRTEMDNALVAAARDPAHRTLAARVRAVWPALKREQSGARVLEQAVGLAMCNPGRHGGIARTAAQEYLPAMLTLCPADWSDRRRLEVAAMTLATLRGLLLELATSGDSVGVDAGFEALVRALEREEAAGG
ncbi:TetR/AcrR family transcriptional regulator [Streptomyces sp. NPDC001404]|uniref:TetR/AcrR family transcriptional regulator n=1 Tax=Streptomyces sp. NPDC001404 TaxID=3364571 RepID=UPI0036C22516